LVFGFGRKNKGVTAAVNKISGKTDKMEAFVAADVLVAASEGGVSKDEYNEMYSKLTSSKVLAGFAPNDIKTTLDRMIKRIESGGRGAKRELMSEIREAMENDNEISEALMLDAMDIADDSDARDGSGIGEKEAKILDEIGDVVGQKNWRDWI
jgi:tellurite resistance protein